jgi:hypothetical protein
MKPEEILPTVEQKARVEARSFRMFLIEHEDGSQQLINIFHDSHLAQLASRRDRWASWSAPIWLQEIWD